MDIGQEEETADVLVLQEAATEAVRQGVGSSQAAGDVGDIAELFSELEAKAGPEVETRAPRRAKASIVESLESEPKERSQTQLALLGPRATPTKKMTRSQTSQASKPSSAHPAKAGRKKQKSASKYFGFGFLYLP